jgi:hypothetical protein
MQASAVFCCCCGDRDLAVASCWPTQGDKVSPKQPETVPLEVYCVNN